MAPKRKVTSRRRAKQTSLPFPLTPAQQTTYRAPAWQQRVDVYAANHFLPVELTHCRRLGLRFLPFEAELISRQLIGMRDLQRKVQLFIGSLYVYDAAYALLHELKTMLENLLSANENVDSLMVINLLNNIRGYQFLELKDDKTNGDITVGANKYIASTTPASPSVQLHVLSTTEENQIRSKGYVQIDGVPYTVGRMPGRSAVGADKGDNYPDINGTNPGSMPFAITADGEIAVESCVNQLLELANSRTISPNYFSPQSRMAVFYPLGLEGPGNGLLMAQNNNGDVSNAIRLQQMMGQGVNLMDNGTRTKSGQPGLFTNALVGAVPGLATDANKVDFPNSMRLISVPGSVTGWGKTMNAAVMEVQLLNTHQRDLIARLGDWAENGMGILAMDGVGFDQYLEGKGHRNVMGNKPRQMKYMEANYANDTCGSGYKRVWFTQDPDDGSGRARQVPGYLPSKSGGMVKNIEARYAKCAPYAHAGGMLPQSGPGVYTDMVYATAPRGAIAAQRRKKRTPAKKKTPAKRKAPAKKK